jgi:hypothetical protein
MRHEVINVPGWVMTVKVMGTQERDIQHEEDQSAIELLNMKDLEEEEKEVDEEDNDVDEDTDDYEEDEDDTDNDEGHGEKDDEGNDENEEAEDR